MQGIIQCEHVANISPFSCFEFRSTLHRMSNYKYLDNYEITEKNFINIYTIFIKFYNGISYDVDLENVYVDKLTDIAEKASKAAASAMEKAKEGMKKAELTEEQCTTGGGTWDKANKKCKQAFESFKEAAESAAATADQAADAAVAAAEAEDDEEEANEATSEAVAKEGFRNYW